MRRRFWLWFPALTAACGSIGCGGGSGGMAAPEDAGPGQERADAHAPRHDAAAHDASHRDARAPMDGGVDARSDASPSDARPVDARMADAKTADAGVPDAADASAVDALADEGVPGDGSIDAAPADGGVPDTAPIDAGLPPITVSGTVNVRGLPGTPVIGRGVDILDAVGNNYTSFTSATGTFSIAGVVPPYALAVQSDGVDAPAVYLGLLTPTPSVVAQDSLEVALSADVAVGITLPTCGTPDCTVFASVDSNGLAGDWEQLSYPAGSVQSLTLNTAWFGATTASVNVQVLVADSALTNYWYATAGGSAVNGVTLKLGSITPAFVSYAGSLSTTTTVDPTLASWPIRQEVDVRYATGAAIQLLSSPGATLSATVPNLPGMTLLVSAAARPPSVDAGSSYLYEAASGTAFDLKPGALSLALDLYAPPVWTSPSAPGATVSSTGTLAWTPTSGGSAAIDFVHVLIGYQEVFVFTSGASISLTDLATMGVVLAPGSGYVSMTEFLQGSSLDTLVGSGGLSDVLDYASPNVTGIESDEMGFVLGP